VQPVPVRGLLPNRVGIAAAVGGGVSKSVDLCRAALTDLRVRSLSRPRKRGRTESDLTLPSYLLWALRHTGELASK
jgi:hypothetical protein